MITGPTDIRSISHSMPRRVLSVRVFSWKWALRISLLLIMVLANFQVGQVGKDQISIGLSPSPAQAGAGPVLTLSDNGRYFMNPDGTTYTMLGANLFFVGYRGIDDTFRQQNYPQYGNHAQWIDGYFKTLSDHGINYIRVFTSNARLFAVDCEQVGGRDFSHPVSSVQANMDLTLDTAAKYGIKITITLFSESGGYWCYWTDAETRDIVDYYVDRYGDHPGLGMWDMINEPHSIRRTTWLDALESYLRQQDDDRHPIMLQFNTGNSYSGGQSVLDNVDALSIRSYEGNLFNKVDVMHGRIENELGWTRTHPQTGEQVGYPIYQGEGRDQESSTNPADAASSEATLHSLWVAYASGATGMHPWQIDRNTNHPMLSDEELDYFYAISRVLPRLGLGELGYENANANLSSSGVNTYAIAAGNGRLFGYLWNRTGSSVTPQVKISGLSSGRSYTIEWVDPATGDIRSKVTRTASGSSITITAPQIPGDTRSGRYDDNSLGVFVYDGAPAPTPTFNDVSLSHWAYDAVEALYQGGFISGCSTTAMLYCPEDPMTRAESAVFVERGLNGGGFTPPAPGEPMFADVALSEWFAKWAGALWDDGMTAGCATNPLRYCPQAEHLRAEATVFFLRMLNGESYEPPQPVSQVYDDVPIGANAPWFSRWVAAAYAAGLTEGCEAPDERGDNLFRPDEPLTRAEAACMMARAKSLTSES